MTDDLVKRLRAQHNDTWPLKIGHGDLINEDGPEAADRIEKLEAALREIGQTATIVDENWSQSYHAPRFTQKQAEGLSEALSARIKIARKALEGKDD